MNKTNLLLLLLACLIQWIVPGKMIWDNEQLYTSGIAYKIRTVPVDPNDPFRGKYITLRFDINNYEAFDIEDLDISLLEQPNQKVYIELRTDKEGFAAIDAIRLTPPNSSDYLTAHIRSFYQRDEKYFFRFAYPFQTYFMEETKAPKAEQLYRDALRVTDQNVYALVNVQAGKAVLKDVLVDGVPIKEMVEEEILER